MTLKYLLDTNILSEAKRPKPNHNVMEQLRLYKRKIATATLVIRRELFRLTLTQVMRNLRKKLGLTQAELT